MKYSGILSKKYWDKCIPTKEDISELLCDHRDEDSHTDTLIIEDSTTNKCFCKQCAATFKLINFDDENAMKEIEFAIDVITNVIENLKLLNPAHDILEIANDGDLEKLSINEINSIPYELKENLAGLEYVLKNLPLIIKLSKLSFSEIECTPMPNDTNE